MIFLFSEDSRHTPTNRHKHYIETDWLKPLHFDIDSIFTIYFILVGFKH